MYNRNPGNPGGYQSSQNGSYNNGQQTGSQQQVGYSSSSTVNYPQSGYSSSSVNYQQTGCASQNGMFSAHCHDHHHGHHHDHHHSIIEEILDPHHHHHHHHCK